MRTIATIRDTNFQTASELAYQIISQKIIDGEYEPGMKLSRRKMAEVTGVSVIPVIEALKKLEEDFLVESKPQWGSFVAVPTKEKVVKSYQVREAIECQVARILSQSITKEQVGEIMAIATELDTVPYTQEHIVDSRKYHMEFHTKLAEYTGNEMLVMSLKRINLFWLLCRALGVRAKNTQYPRYWHRKLVDMIVAGDPDLAENAMREHVQDSLIPSLAAWDEGEQQ